MANFKNAKNLLRQRDEYARYFSGFRGVDFSSDHTEVADNRFAYLVNMYKDYDCGQGGAVETIPGFREISSGGDNVNGIHVGGGKAYIHLGKVLWCFANILDDGSVENLESWTNHGSLSDNKSVSFNYGGALYILDGSNYYKLQYDEQRKKDYLIKVTDIAYLPTVREEIDIAASFDSVADDYGEGREHEQRNLLNECYKVTVIPDGEHSTMYLISDDIPDDAQFFGPHDATSPSDAPQMPSGIRVYQYGVELPLAGMGSDAKPFVPYGYPNAILEIVKKTSLGGPFIKLVDPPPKPEENTWNPTAAYFDYTADEIKSGVPEEDGYQWTYAWPSGCAGIEIIPTRPILNVGGVNVEKQSDIINKCTIAAVFDNRVFLSGNPDFKTQVFYCRINEETGVPDPTFFGQLNYTTAGMSDAEIVALMPIGDSLMVLKKDGDEEESVVLLTAQTGPSDILTRVYPAERGHRGIGALGPCINFRDDPIFLSRFGVDALGHVSTKYRRAIKHRSTLIDAKLLECNDLSEASITEWNGYLLILSEGKIFMADSRQMYNTDSGNTEYEWYYLEDIGIYKNQFDEYVYAELPTEMSKEEFLEITGGVELLVADNVRDTYGVERDLIGTLAFENKAEITYIKHTDGNIYYKELPEVDEFGIETGRTMKYYVEPSGGKTGGTFDPAVLIKAIGKNLYFATQDGSLCQFNFDKRDPNTRIIPNEYYDFNGRTIFSGCATKMDNCGIPHLNKTTVKRSMVLKTRSFMHSGLKVKIRTNKKDFTQVGRIVSGRATFDDPSFKGYTFSMSDTNIFSINEREKKWVEKQIFVFSDGFRCPIAVHYLIYRYNVAGRYKE